MHTSETKVLISLEDILGPDCTVVSAIMIVKMSKIRSKISLAKKTPIVLIFMLGHFSVKKSGKFKVFYNKSFYQKMS